MVSSVAREFGFEEHAETRDEAADTLLRIFEMLCDEKNDKDIRKIIERFLTIYADLIDEKQHEKGLIGTTRKILWQGHFHIAFHTGSKAYVVEPYEGHVHGIAEIGYWAGPRGFEPRSTVLETVILPLNYRPICGTSVT